MSGQRYPENELPIAAERETLSESLSGLREAYLINYSYNTARAYWGDLDDLFYWAFSRDKDVITLTAKELRQYVALLRRRHYSENTIRRRVTAFRGFFEVVVDRRLRQDNPANEIVIGKKN